MNNTWAKDAGNVLAQSAHEVSEGREVRAAGTTQGNEGHVFATGAFDPTAADNALRVGKEHHLQEHRGPIRRGARLIVSKARIKARQIDRVIEQVVQRMLEGARQQLALKIHGKKAWACIDLFVPGHVHLHYVVLPLNLDIPSGSRHDDTFYTASLGGGRDQAYEMDSDPIPCRYSDRRLDSCPLV